MAALSHSGSRRLYSWWWDSHNCPKNSKWLQENLRDMDAKVKTMIKLIEEDADSFARRAEMYYKKRPELMKLVEEFYRAYRALAERYDHATGELRHAQRTIAEAFPDQESFELVDDSPLKSPANDMEPYTPEMKHPGRGLAGTDDLHKSGVHAMKKNSERAKQNLNQEKEIKESVHDEMLKLSKENLDLKDKVLSESTRAGKAETEIQNLKKALAGLQAEKEEAVLQYQQCLEKLSSLEGELGFAQSNSTTLSEKATRAEIEVQTLKEAFAQLEVERDVFLAKHKEYMEKIAELENMASVSQEEMKQRAIDAEKEVEGLKDELSRLELEKDDVVHQYRQNLGKISALEKLISAAEDEVRLFKKQADIAETEVAELKAVLADLLKEKEASALRYKCCLEMVSKLENELSRAEEDVKRLNNELLNGTAKLKDAEEKCLLLESSNQSLRVEADDLLKKIAIKDREISESQEELEKLQTHLQDDHMRHAQIEATLQTLQNLQAQSQEDQKALALELKNGLQMLKDLEVCKHGLEEEIRKVKDDNHSLSQFNLSSTLSMDNMRNEILGLCEMKERLEQEVSQQIGKSDSLQQEILRLKEEMEGLDGRYHALRKELEAAGLNPKCVGASIKTLKDENSQLRQIYEEESNQKEFLLKKLEKMDELLQEKDAAESSLSEMNYKLDRSCEEVIALQESFQFLRGEKSALAAEKAALLSQINAITESMHKLLEKNAVLENSLSTAKIELEGLRAKSQGLEEICHLLKDQRANLVTERDNLATKLEYAERGLEAMEKKYSGLEEKYADVEKEKEAMQCQVKELKVSISMEKQEWVSSKIQTESRLAVLQNHIHLLQEENRLKKKEFEDELDKALKAQFEISILQKFVKEMEGKNCSLIVECQKHVEASKLAEKLIQELESENLEQQVEAELLFDEIGRLRLGIYQVCRALEMDTDSAPEDKFENGQTFVHHILGNIEVMKNSISKHEDDRQQILVENSVLLTLLKQLESKGKEVELQKINLEHEFKIMAEKLVMAEKEKEKLLEMNRLLKSEVNEGHQHAFLLEAELECLFAKQSNLHKDYLRLEEANSQALEDNKSLLEKFSDLKDEKCQVDQENDALLFQLETIANQSTVFRSFSNEKIAELQLLLEDIQKQQGVNNNLQKEMVTLRKKLEIQEAENITLNDALQRLEMELQAVRANNVQMEHQITRGKEMLIHREEDLLEAEMKLKKSENLNSTLCETVNGLKAEMQNSMLIRENLENTMIHMSEEVASKNKEIESLLTVNANMTCDLDQLHQQIEEKRGIEQNLSLELEEKNSEFELWEAEAAGFYFDLQISSIREVLFENMVIELTGVCQNLEKESASKTYEIDQMKQRIRSMESQIGGLKSRLYAYAPVISSLVDDVAALQEKATSRTTLKGINSQELEGPHISADPHGKISEDILEDQVPIPNGVEELQKLQHKIKEIGKAMEESEKLVSQRILRSSIKQEDAMSEIKQLKPQRSFGRDKFKHKLGGSPKFQKAKSKRFDTPKGTSLKDIPLDRASDSSSPGVRRRNTVGGDDMMLEMWIAPDNPEFNQTIGESLNQAYKSNDQAIKYGQLDRIKRNSEHPSTDLEVERELGVDKLELSTRYSEPREEANRKILERLASDAQKLESLQTLVQNLRMKLEANRKNRKAKHVDFETVEEQLLEAEETVMQLVDMNSQLVKNVDQNPSPDGRASQESNEKVNLQKQKITEQARKGSERIGRLQVELQKLQYVLLKLEDEKKSKGKGRFFKSKTIILRDFMYNGRKKSVKKKKGPLCGCFKPSASRNGRNSVNL